MQKSLLQTAIAHARIGVEALHGDPVGRTFIGEGLAPAASARRRALALAVADGAGAGDDVDAVRTGERSRPAADHVVVAAVAVVAEHPRRNRVQARSGEGVFTVRGQAEEGVRDGVRFLLIIFKIATLYSPLKLFAPTAGTFFLVGLGYYGYTYMTQGRFTNMSVLLFSASVIVFLIGLISEQITSLTYRRDA